jgi:hypothetical protein
MRDAHSAKFAFADYRGSTDPVDPQRRSAAARQRAQASDIAKARKPWMTSFISASQFPALGRSVSHQRSTVPAVPTPRPPWPDGVIDSLSAVLAETNWPGSKGPEIGRLLESVRIDDPWPSATRLDRLSAALVNRQVLDRSSHRLVTFMVNAMAPSRYIGDPDRFAALQAGVNEVLSMVGLRINDRGQMAKAQQARTLDEVAI